ncbi:MAG TPA: homoserine kinase [Hyphomonas sp.]|uniref:homoserine kinase n=1 Tax=Hyphomonas sp. TaxID=87 RepID=UPI000E9211E6|nr:homoserine kinase [Hyphomonas sp.]HBU35552.1 homoserine kinase [Hyphomonas sp.]|tara:strand:- start:1553 stop:2533 length:981 start_codon:yes stop_codon:yes gene_type:complete
MAVYTQVSDDALAAFLDEYNLGKALSFKGIAEGVENSNYYLETTTGRFILTLFEKRVNADDLPYFIGLKQHLAGKGFPCPEPILAKDGKALRTLEGRPAVIVSFLDGLSPKKPTPAQCRGLGEGLARMHVTLSDFEMTRPNSLGPSAWPRLWAGQSDEAEKLQPGLSALIDEALADIAEAKPKSLTLPRGTIHADLFPDNAFFLGEDFSGIIDFYFACTDALAYDLAICLNAWAFDDNPGRGAIDYNYSKGANLIAGYESVRPLQPTERDALPLLARGAALRFFLTRMVDWTSTPEGALVKPKNPLEYAGRLAFHRKVTSAEGYGA